MAQPSFSSESSDTPSSGNSLLDRSLLRVLPLSVKSDAYDEEDEERNRVEGEEKSGEIEEEGSGMEEEDGSGREEESMLTAIGLCLWSLACCPLSLVCISTLFRCFIGPMCVNLYEDCQGSGERKRSTRTRGNFRRLFFFYTWRRLRAFHFLYIAGLPLLFFLILGGVSYGTKDSRHAYRGYYGAESYAWAMPAIGAGILYCQLLFMCVALHWSVFQSSPIVSPMSFFRPMPIVDSNRSEGPLLFLSTCGIAAAFLLAMAPRWLSHDTDDDDENDDGGNMPDGDNVVIVVYTILQLIPMWTLFAGRLGMSHVPKDSQLWRMAMSNLGGFLAEVDEAVNDHSSELRRQNNAKHRLVHYLTLYYLHVASDDSNNPDSHQEASVARMESVGSAEGDEAIPELGNEKPALREHTSGTGGESDALIESGRDDIISFGPDDEDDTPLLQGSSGVPRSTSKCNMADSESEVQRVFDALNYLMHAFPTAIKQRDKHGNTPLHLCAMLRTGSWYTFNTFIDGIKPDQRAARIARTIRQLCPEAIELRNAEGRTPLEEMESTMERQKSAQEMQNDLDIAPDPGFVLTPQVLKDWDYDETVTNAEDRKC
jgi:hypothetical protein